MKGKGIGCSQEGIINTRKIFKHNSLLGKQHEKAVQNSSIGQAEQEKKTHIRKTQEQKTRNAQAGHSK